MNDERDWGDWFRHTRSRLQRGGLYLDGGEPGRPGAAGFDAARLRILFCRLSTYEDVLPSITHRILFWAARQVPGVYADLAFLPPRADLEMFDRDGAPWWLASGCKRPPSDFDVVAISISAQQEALNLPAALQRSGLRLAFAERMNDADHPLVLLGGHAAGSVPFVHGDAAGAGSGGLVDAVCVGDGIVWIQELLRRIGKSKSKDSFLRELARELPGTYVPSLYRHSFRGARVSIETAGDGIPLPVRHREDGTESWAGGYDGGFIPFSNSETEETLPLSFGCSFRCRFCQTGWIRSTLAETGFAELRAAAARLKAATAASDLNLLASDACSVDGLAEIIAGLLDVFPRVSVKSLSIASLARRGDLMRLLAQIDKREFTFGVEGVSPRLRAWLGKSVDVTALVELVASLAAGGLRQLKLFFIATGLEGEADLDAFGRLLDRIRRVAPGCRLITSFTPLFHAPFTPLQFEAMRGVAPDLAKRIESTSHHSGAEFRWSAYPGEIRLMNWLVRAGRRATPSLVRLSLDEGIRYYDDVPEAGVAAAERLLRDDGIGLEELEQAFGERAVLPWDDIEAGSKKRTLWLSHKKAHSLLDGEEEDEFLAEPERYRPRRTPPHRAAPSRRLVWATLENGDAFRPEITVARGLLRDLFIRSPGTALAYAGDPRIHHPSGTYGLAVLGATFNGPVELPDAFDGTTDLVYATELDAGSTRRIEERLRSDAIPFQSVRRADGLWSVVKKGYRKKTGLVAFCRRETEPDLVLCHDDATFDPGGRVTAILEMAPSKCPTCRAPTLRILKTTGDSALPHCVECLLT